MATTTNNGPWFGIAMGFAGIIVGFAIGSGMQGNQAPAPAPAVVQAPTPSAPTPTPAPEAPPAGEVKEVDLENDNIRGSKDAVISLIEYSDFECPFCSRHHPTMQQLVDDYDGKVNWVYRHFPLSFHPNAQKASEGSQCARELGGNDAFWDFADLIFESGPDVANLPGYAVDLGLDEAKFKDCLDSGKYEQYVKDDMASGQAAGVRGTPGNIVFNNKTKESKVVSGAQPAANFKTIIDGML